LKSLFLYLKKNIISLDSDYLGRYFKYRNKLYSKALDLKIINLSDDQNKSKIKNKILNRSSIKGKNQKKYLFSNQLNRIGLKDIINKIKKLN